MDQQKKRINKNDRSAVPQITAVGAQRCFRQKKKEIFRKTFSLFCCLFLALSILSPAYAFTAESPAFPAHVFAAEAPAAGGLSEDAEEKVVRIGWYQSDLFQEGLSDSEPKSGYSYEYIHKVSDYNGWTYEYVYGDWTELYEKLLSGDIDLLAGVSKTQERMDRILYPDEVMGYEHYVLYQHQGGSMDAQDLSTFSGKKIGAITDNLMTTYLESWLAENKADAEIVYYDSFEKRDRDFDEGRIDALVTTNNGVLTSSGYSQVVEVGKESYYLAVSMSRPDLQKDLNSAQGYIEDIEPYYISNLEYDNYGTTLANSTLSALEEEWLSRHSTMVIGYLDRFLPFCGTDENGNVQGLITDVMDAIRKELNITDRLNVTYQAYESSDELVAALKNGEIDAAFPVSGETWYLEQDGINATNDVVTTADVLVTRGDLSGDVPETIAVAERNAMAAQYARKAYPDARIVMYDSIDDCLAAVRKGTVESTIINELRTDLVKKNREYNSLTLKRIDLAYGRCLGVADGNTALHMLLNRGLRLIGTEFGNNAAYSYMSGLYTNTFTDVLFDNAGLFAGLFSLIIAIVLAAVIRDRHKSARMLRMEAEKNRELEAARKEAEAADRAKTTFLFNMSHDIRTPMNAIIGFTDLVVKHYDDKEKCMDYLRKTQDANRFLLSLINNVLEMARIESGNVSLTEERCDAEQFNAAVYSVFEEQMKQKNITFTQKVEVQHPYVFCDPVKLREIYLNILSNAYKYTPAGGSVSLELKELPSDREGMALYRTTISDTGIGMSKEFLPHLFEEFSRAKSATESRIEGTGLGMSIVKKYVELMGGTIRAESELGKGSTFIISICHRIANQSDQPKTEPASSGNRNFEGKRILLAEDNDLNAEIAAEILGEAGFQTERAADGAVCLKMLENAAPGYYDVILMDIQMPNMNGYETAKRIRRLADPVKAGIPIIAMTANAFEEDKKNALAAGMNGHLAKPIEVPKLMEALASIFA